jgi:hypothetical protein
MTGSFVSPLVRSFCSSTVRRILRSVFDWVLRVSSCSQIRRTVQPLARKARVTSVSRARFLASFVSQKSVLFLGFVACVGQECQKHPSTNIASLSFRKTKSGLPNTAWCLLQPVMPPIRSNFASAISVSLLPRPRILDMTSERFSFVKTSLTRLRQR